MNLTLIDEKHLYRVRLHIFDKIGSLLRDCLKVLKKENIIDAHIRKEKKKKKKRKRKRKKKKKEKKEKEKEKKEKEKKEKEKKRKEKEKKKIEPPT